MNQRQIEALAKKNAAKAAQATGIRKGFGKKYDINLKDEPLDEATLKEREREQKFFKEMRKREFRRGAGQLGMATFPGALSPALATIV